MAKESQCKYSIIREWDVSALGNYGLKLPRESFITSVSLGKAHGAALSKDGSVYTWGTNKRGQCGRKADNDTKYVLTKRARSVPVREGLS